MLSTKSRPASGFTIVELLVVIVVIGILAAVTIVSYTGISQKATVASLKSDLSTATKTLKMYYTDNGTYPKSLNGSYCSVRPDDTTDSRYCLKASSGNTYTYYSSSPWTTFSLLATNTNGTVYFVNESTGPIIPPILAIGGTIAEGGGTRTHTFSPGTYVITVTKSGTITVTARGAGGGGGRQDSVGDATAGTNGDLVSSTIVVTFGDSLSVQVGQSGSVGSLTVSGATGGTGYTAGLMGGAGGSTAGCEVVWGFGGAGGGGSSGVSRSSIRLIEARGGNGGNSSSSYVWVDCADDWRGAAGGGGGGGGGTNFPALTTQYGGGGGGAIDNGGGAGVVTISYPY